jgi:hypothetical protein
VYLATLGLRKMYLSTALPSQESILTHSLMAIISPTYGKLDHVISAYGILISMEFAMMCSQGYSVYTNLAPRHIQHAIRSCAKALLYCTLLPI